MSTQICALGELTDAASRYHECAELVKIYGGGVDGLLDDIAAGMSRNDIAQKVGTNVRTLNRFILDAIPDVELQAAVDAHYSTLISEGIGNIRDAEDMKDIRRGKLLVEAAVLVAQFESPKYRPIKQDLKVTRITVDGLSGFMSEQMPVIDAEVQSVEIDVASEASDASHPA